MEKLARLPFSWLAFLLAPWPAPFICGLIFTFGTESAHWGVLLLVTFGAGLTISFLGTATLVLTLWFVAYIRTVTKSVSACVGLAIGAVGYLPVVFVNWKSSGPDSGPPVDSFTSYLAHSFDEPFLYMFAGAGIATALIYDFLARLSGKPAT